MAESTTVITVGVTETDEYGNLWVTPQGGGEKIKIAKKRENLHPLFQQAKAVMLEWQTYMNRPYVANAKPVEGVLSPPQEPKMLPEQQVQSNVELKPTHNPQEIGMWWKEMGENFRTGLFKKDEKIGSILYRIYCRQMLQVLGIEIEKGDA